ncbi:MAG: T9SS type A sorting domain-containing protein [Bacteroidia bacterium]
MKAFLIATITFFNLSIGVALAQCPGGWLQTIQKADRAAMLSQSTTDDSGNFYIALSFYDTIRAGNLTLAATGDARQYQDIGLIKIGKDGNPAWAIQSYLQPHLFVRHVEVDKDFNIHLIVYSNATSVQFGGIQAGTDTTGAIYRVLIRPDGSVSSIVPLIQRGDTGGLIAIPSYNFASDGRTGLLFNSFMHEAVIGQDTLFSNANSWFLAAFDQTGQRIWVVQGGEAETIFPGSIVVGKDGSVYLSFSFFGNLVLQNGDSIINRTLFEGSDVGVSRYTDDGNLHWTKAFTGLVDETVILTYADDHGNFYGSLSNLLDPYWNDTIFEDDDENMQFVRIDSMGNVLDRLKLYGQNIFLGGTEGYKNNRLLISGSYKDSLEVAGFTFSSYPQNFSDPRKGFLVILDTAFHVLNSIELKSSKHITVAKPYVSDNDHIYISGGFNENLDLPSTQLSMPGQWGSFVWKTCMQELTAIKEPKIKRHQQKAIDLVCIPNPALHTTSIEVPDGKISSVDVFDLTGRPVLHIPLPKVISGRITLDVATLPRGLYTILVASENGRSVGRFVKDGL